MHNCLRALIYGDQVSLTLINVTELVNVGVSLHKLSPASALAYGKAMAATTYMSACLKEEKGEISLTLQCDGEAGSIGVSGNRALYMRGYIGNGKIAGNVEDAERRALGENGSFTIVRDDGYSRPFVGTCAFPDGGDFDRTVEEYYRVSEQLPTRIKTVVEVDEKGCAFAGVAVLQPLPFATDEVLKKVADTDTYALASALKNQSVEQVAKEYFAVEKEGYQLRYAQYKCNCSREYLSAVLVTLGEAQLRDIIRTEGAVRVHCHYCNCDYEFTSADADGLFPKKI